MPRILLWVLVFTALIAIGLLIRGYRSRLVALRERLLAVRSTHQSLLALKAELAALQADDPASLDAVKVVKHATSEELSALQRVLDLGAESTPNDIVRAVRRYGSHSLVAAARQLVDRDPYVPYDEVVTDVARRLKCELETNTLKTSTIAEIEEVVVRKAFSDSVLLLTEAQLDAFEAELRALGGRHGKDFRALAATSVTTAAGNASGFSVYLMASTVTGALSNAVGVSLPFVFYKSMSSTLAALLGPVGWAALGAWGLHKASDLNYEKTIPGVLFIAYIRARLDDERSSKIQRVLSAIEAAEAQIRRLSMEAHA